ncbi:MAG: heteromeric transposase endonuclease subunit TnsA [Brevinematales bacterium]|nr:heteromeric transposase endonuclease subunit TnsA [Brevinematales bacterium]
MAKQRTVFSEEKIAQRIEEGRGSGEGKDYHPWLTIQDVPSLGRVSRIHGWKTDRIHHLVSDGESRIFYLLEWANPVIDIREQFPLLDREHSQRIAEDIHIKHPHYPGTTIPYVLTTDFMITVLSDGQKKYLARTFKYPEEFTNDAKYERMLGKFEIERIYWEERGIDWGIIKETDKSKALAKNIEWIHEYYWSDGLTVKNRASLRDMLESLKMRLRSGRGQVLPMLSELDAAHGEEDGTFLALTRHLIARKEIAIDMYGKMDFNRMDTDSVFVSETKFKGENLA